MPRELPDWIHGLDVEDLHLIQDFILAGGSLKVLAAHRGVCYRTIRARLDALSYRVRLLHRHRGADLFEQTLRRLVGEGALPPRLGEELLVLHHEAARAGRPMTGFRLADVLDRF